MASSTRSPAAGTNVAVAFAHGSWSNPHLACASGTGVASTYIGDLPTAGKFTTILQLASFGLTYPNPIVVKGLAVTAKYSKLDLGAVTHGPLRCRLRSDAPGQPAINVYKDFTPGYPSGSLGTVTLGSSVDLWGAAWSQLQTEWVYVQLQGFPNSHDEEDGNFSATVDYVTVTVYYSQVLSGVAVLGGGGGLLGTGALVGSGAVLLSGSGVASAVGRRTVFASASLSGGGSVTAAGEVIPLTRRVEVTWAQFELPAGVPAPVVSGSASLSGSGSLSASGLSTPTVVGAAALSGAGAAVAVGVIPVDGRVLLVGSSSLLASGERLATGAAVLAGQGSLVAIGQAFTIPPSVRAVEMEAVDLAVEMEAVDLAITLETIEQYAEML